MRVIKYLYILLFINVFSGCTQLDWPSISVLLKDRKAAQLAEKENYADALTQYYSVLDEAPQNPEVHSNIGVLLKQKTQIEEALKSLNYALDLAKLKNDSKAIFAIQFNLGVYYGSLKKIPEALEHYQAALELNADSIETKTNIELLMQQQQQQQSGGEGDKNDQKDQSKSDQDQKKQDQKQNEGKKESSGKYKPRPFKGDQLSESDVKKILGELKNQEQKIRSNFDKKEKKGKTSKNEKDW